MLEGNFHGPIIRSSMVAAVVQSLTFRAVRGESRPVYPISIRREGSYVSAAYLQSKFISNVTGSLLDHSLSLNAGKELGPKSAQSRRSKGYGSSRPSLERKDPIMTQMKQRITQDDQSTLGAEVQQLLSHYLAVGAPQQPKLRGLGSGP